MLALGSPLARMGGGIQVTSPVHLFDFGLPHRVSAEGLPLSARGQVSALLAGPGTGPEPSWQPHPPGRRGERSAHFPQPGTDSLLETENSVGRDPETGHRCDPWAEARSQGDRGRAGEGGLPGPIPPSRQAPPLLLSKAYWNIPELCGQSSEGRKRGENKGR